MELACLLSPTPTPMGALVRDMGLRHTGDVRVLLSALDEQEGLKAKKTGGGKVWKVHVPRAIWSKWKARCEKYWKTAHPE
jgi:hypothetical protein